MRKEVKDREEAIRLWERAGRGGDGKGNESREGSTREGKKRTNGRDVVSGDLNGHVEG